MTKCIQEGCNVKQPAFNIQGEKTGKFCGKHKEVGMVDVKSKRCEHDGCSSHPTFDIEGGKGKFCGKHKEAGMVDVKSKRCAHDGCSSLNPHFDIEGGKGKFCGKHKTAEMVDVQRKHCALCQTCAYYGKPGTSPSHCAKHRQAGMIKRSNGKCKTSNCKELALYGQNWIPRHCELHKEPEEHNLVERECKSCKLIMVLDVKDTCEFCNPEAFQSAKLAKQNALFAYLSQRTDIPKPYSSDTIVDGGVCGKERPDQIYDLGDKIVIVECDEHQHKDRQCLCEQTRMVNIGQTFGGLPVYFLRWNPDDYAPEDDKKDPELLAKRHKLLGDLLRDISSLKYKKLPNALVSALYVYYDGWDTLQNEKWHILTEFHR